MRRIPKQGDIFHHYASKEEFTGVVKPKYKLVAWCLSDLDIFVSIAGTSNKSVSKKSKTLTVEGKDLVITTTSVKHIENLSKRVGSYALCRLQQLQAKRFSKMMRVAELTQQKLVEFKEMISHSNAINYYKATQHEKLLDLIDVDHNEVDKVLDKMIDLGIEC